MTVNRAGCDPVAPVENFGDRLPDSGAVADGQRFSDTGMPEVRRGQSGALHNSGSSPQSNGMAERFVTMMKEEFSVHAKTGCENSTATKQ
jgi:hypothetical protein